MSEILLIQNVRSAGRTNHNDNGSLLQLAATSPVVTQPAFIEQFLLDRFLYRHIMVVCWLICCLIRCLGIGWFVIQLIVYWCVSEIFLKFYGLGNGWIYNMLCVGRVVGLFNNRDMDRNGSIITVRTEPGVCPEPVFSRTKRPFFSTDPHEVCEGLLPQIVVKRTMKQILCRTHGEATPSVPAIPAVRLEPWMKHVFKPWEKRDILCHRAKVRFCK